MGLRVEVALLGLVHRVVDVAASPPVFSEVVSRAPSTPTGLRVLIRKLLVVELVWSTELSVLVPVHGWRVLVVGHLRQRVEGLRVDLDVVAVSPSSSLLSSGDPSAPVVWLTLIKAGRH